MVRCLISKVWIYLTSLSLYGERVIDSDHEVRNITVVGACDAPPPPPPPQRSLARSRRPGRWQWWQWFRGRGGGGVQ